MSSVSTGCYFNFLVSVEACFLSKYVVSFGKFWGFFVFHWNVVWISVRFIFMMLCSSSLSLIDFCLNELSAGETSVLKYSTVTVWVSACDLSFFVFSFMGLVHRCLELQYHLDGFHLMSMLYPSISLLINLIWILFCQINDYVLGSWSVCLGCLFPSFYPEVMLLYGDVTLWWLGFFLNASERWVLFSNPLC